MRHWFPAFLLFAVAPLAADVDPDKNLLAGWSVLDARAVALLRDAGFRAVLVPFPGEDDTISFARACREGGLVPVAEIGGVTDEAALRTGIDSAAAAGFAGVAFDALASEQATQSVAGARKDLVSFVFLKPEQVHWRVEPARAVLREGRWPGMQPPDPSVASATESYWVDANSFVAGWLRGVHPERAALLGYRPDENAGVSKHRMIHFDSLELVLADAFAGGGNAILYFPEIHQKAILEGKQQALETWRSLADTARFLKEHLPVFRSPAASRVAVAAGTFEQSGELLNMLYRRNVSPAVFPAASLPEWQPGRSRVLVAANIATPSEAGRRRALDLARSGGQVMAAPAADNDPKWWRDPAARVERKEEEREIHALGSGRVFGYAGPIIDPAEFALDVIDALGMRTRDLRIWGADTVIGVLGAGRGGRTSVILVNYGHLLDEYEFLIRVEGAFSKAILREPGGAPSPLRVAARGSGTEINIDHLRRLALIDLE